jgi:hypothetical protein
MVIRTADPILVTEDQLARAIDVVVSVCERYRVGPNISISKYCDPEIEGPPVTMISVELTREPVGDYYALIGEVASSLRAVKLHEPWLPLSAHLVPAW